MNLRTIGKLFGLGVALAILALAAGNQGQIGAAQAGCTVTLQPGESIQNAIDNISPGAVICLSEGSWLENLIITKDNLTLRGQGRNETVVTGEFMIKVSQRFIVENMTLQSGFIPPPCARTVQPGESIQEAIDQAEEGAMICLAEGAWEENIKIEKSLTLSGAGKEKTIIKGKKEGYPVIWIESDSEIEVTLEGLTIAEAKGLGCGVVGYPQWICPDGILILGKAKATIKDSTISGNGKAGYDGLRVGDYANVSLQDSTISGNRKNGLYVRGSANVSLQDSTVSGNGHYGLGVVDSANVSLQDSTVSGNGDYGLAVGDLAKVSLTNSTVSGDGDYGLGVGGFANVSLKDSTISGNRKIGLYVKGSANVSLQDSTISGNGENGLYVGDSANMILINSTVSGNGGGGLSVWGSANMILVNSRVSGNNDGILVVDKSQTAIINSIISDNTDWGVAAWLKKCGYPWDEFTGKVIFLGNNQIYRNGKDVCLP